MTHSLSFEPPRPRQFGAVNWLGLGVLTGKEIRRFIKVYAQTIVAPMISTLLFYVVFAVALGNNGRMIEGVPYMTFLVPGLVMMSMGQNAFANTSSAIVIAKVQGNIVDVLMPPLSAGELTAGFTIGGIMRGLAVGLISILVLAPVADLPFQHPFFIVYNALLGSMMLALIGLIGGIWADKFDHMATVQNFIIMPATFLSGTFYTADRLPQVWQWLCRLNPFFYMIDGFRYGFIGLSSGDPVIGLAVLAVSDILLLLVAYRMFAVGYKLKS